MNIVICQRPSSASRYAGWVRTMLPDADVTVVTQRGSAAEMANRGYARIAAVDEYDGEEFTGVLERLATKGIDRIICNSEDDTVRVARVRSLYGVTGLREDLAVCFRDKLEMKGLFSRTGVPYGPYDHVRSAQEIRRFVDEHGTAVLKPRGGAGAIGVHVLADQSQVDAIVGQTDTMRDLKEGKLLIESFLPGDVYHADVLIDGPGIRFMSISRYIHKPYRFKEKNYGSVMMDESGKRTEIAGIVNRFVAGLPSRSGVYVLHFEFIDDADGSAKCGEVAARVGGGLIKRTISYSYGIDMSRELCRLELGLPISFDGHASRRLTGWLVRTGGPRLHAPAHPVDWLIECEDDGTKNTPTDSAEFAGTAIVSGKDEAERQIHLYTIESENRENERL